MIELNDYIYYCTKCGWFSVPRRDTCPFCQSILKKYDCQTIEFFDLHAVTAPQMGFQITTPQGLRLVFCGDEPYRLPKNTYLSNADWAIHESTLIYPPTTASNVHACIRSACELAEEFHVRNLILCHLPDDQLTTRKKTVLEEGKRYFSGNLFCPDDLDVISLL